MMASSRENEGTEPGMGDVLCAEKRLEIEVALNSEISFQMELKREMGKNAECSCSNSNGNQHARGVFPKTYSVK